MAPLWLRSRQPRIVKVSLKSMGMAPQMQRKGLQHGKGRIQMVDC